jgi:RNA polymerase sigma-70 factor (ECF subfamily)
LNTESKQQQFTELYLQVHAQLARYCKALMRDRDDAKDLMSETVAIAFEKFETLRNISSFKYFLFAIAVRLFRKKLSRRREFVGIDEAMAQRSDGVPGDSLSDVGHLYAAINKLSDDKKEIIVLFELSGFSLQEISELKNMNLSTVKTNLSRARQELVKLLNPRKETIH